MAGSLESLLHAELLADNLGSARASSSPELYRKWKVSEYLWSIGYLCWAEETETSQMQQPLNKDTGAPCQLNVPFHQSDFHGLGVSI